MTRKARGGGSIQLSTQNTYVHITWGRHPEPDIPHRPMQTAPRNLLDDVATVLDGEQRIKPRDVAARLRYLAPYHKPYQTLNGKELAEQLAVEGVRITLLEGFPMVYTDRVRDIIAARDALERDG